MDRHRLTSTYVAKRERERERKRKTVFWNAVSSAGVVVVAFVFELSLFHFLLCEWVTWNHVREGARMSEPPLTLGKLAV